MLRRTRVHVEPAWGRPKLLGLVVAAVATAVLMVGGLGLAVYYSLLTPGGSTEGEASKGAPDEMLGQELPSVPASAARPGPLTTERFEVITLPTPRKLGPAVVSTGFPRTPEGALGQLAAIDQATLQSASVPVAQEVITAWAVPGGPTAESWSGVRAMAELLSSAGLTGSGSSSFTVSADPQMGLIRATDGNTVVACVDFVVTATLTQTARVAVADCQRMVWVEGRWMLGPGPEPEALPSVWPGTAEALRVGYRMLRDE